MSMYSSLPELNEVENANLFAAMVLYDSITSGRSRYNASRNVLSFIEDYAITDAAGL